MISQIRLATSNALWKNVLRPYLFGKEAEDAHIFTIRALTRIQDMGLLPLLRLYRSPCFRIPITVFGTEWRNPVGLAAGFDKQAQVIPALDELGFGSAEIGTFTPRPQLGNERPRVFRYSKIFGIINRYAFNSVGAEAGAKRYRWLCSRYQVDMPVGISIRKNKETPDDQAAEDYLLDLRYFLPVMRKKDWVKVPNTPGLRRIFDRLDEFLPSFVERTKIFAREQGVKLPPLVLKLPPDGFDIGRHTKLCRIVEIAAKAGFAGLEATNTTTSEEIKKRFGLSEVGGLSGEPLRVLSTSILEELTSADSKGMSVVGVGGISRGDHALEKREAGAHAVQVYTGLVFRGPTLVHEILKAWK